MFNAPALKIFFKWITKREQARHGHDNQLRKPWTDDPIIQTYRFCNVRRMDDKVSQWLMNNWYNPTLPIATSVIAAALARLINWPDTLAYISGGTAFQYWNPKGVLTALDLWKEAGNKVFTGAYIINGAGGGSKTTIIVNNIKILAQDAHRIVDIHSMQNTHTNLRKYPGFGSFMAGQVMADLRYVVKGGWGDRMSWAPIGPGSRRGMRRLLGHEAHGTMTQAQFEPLLVELIYQTEKRCHDIFHDRKLEAMDVQNCLCEFDKYMRVLNGEGRPRSLYDGVSNQGSLL